MKILGRRLDDFAGDGIGSFDRITGFVVVVQPLCLEQYAAGVANCNASGLPAGWAGILIDAGTGNNTISITNNYVHDGVRGDGIDIRGMNTGDISVDVEYNFVTGLCNVEAFGR